MEIFIAAGILCLFYYFVILIYSGPGETFSLFWAVSGICFIALAAFLGRKPEGLPCVYVIRGVLGVMVICVAGVFLYVESKILLAAAKKAEDGAQIVIILGAQVKKTVPSKSLYRRVRGGAAYLHKNPGATVIVSGGRGPGEDISEAACMERLLIDMGIEKCRIILEENSSDTYENIKNSLSICKKDQRIVIVTCGYHMYRALALTKKAGADKVSGCPVQSNRVLLLNYYVREFFAVLKYKVTGQI